MELFTNESCLICRMRKNEISIAVVNKAAEGDMASFEAIYRSYSGFIYNVILRILQNEVDAQEVVQDVFMIIYRKLSGFKFDSSLKTWMYRIAVNQSLNYVKKRLKEMKGKVEFDEKFMGETTFGVEDTVIYKSEQNSKIMQLLDKLNLDQKACVVLRNMEGLSYQEIAETLKVNINTVRSRLKRAREKLLTLRNEVIVNEM